MKCTIPFPLDVFYYDLFKNEGLKLRNRIIWHFEHGLHCSLRFSGRYETLLWFTKSDDYLFHLDPVRVPAKYPGNLLDSAKLQNVPELTHSQVQTLLGAVGAAKGFDIWIPTKDRLGLDWNLSKNFGCREELPGSYGSIKSILQEVDVIWFLRGSSDVSALFEVEHSTPIYSGLLRFNDVHLVTPTAISRFTIVSNDTRRSLFVRQVNRPTFRTSGLSELCTFLEYVDVFGWHRRITGKQSKASK